MNPPIKSYLAIAAALAAFWATVAALLGAVAWLVVAVAVVVFLIVLWWLCAAGTSGRKG